MFCAIHRSRLRARRPHLEWWRGLKVGRDASVSKCVWEGDNCTTGPVPILKTPGPGQDPALVKLSYCLDHLAEYSGASFELPSTRLLCQQHTEKGYERSVTLHHVTA